jgi:hypothetical protein
LIVDAYMQAALSAHEHVSSLLQPPELLNNDIDTATHQRLALNPEPPPAAAAAADALPPTISVPKKTLSCRRCCTSMAIRTQHEVDMCAGTP